MGWTWYHASEYTKSGRVSPSRQVRKEFENGLVDCYTIIDDAFVNGVYYAAVRDSRDGSVEALVVPTGTSTTDYYNFGYKEMLETWGPCYYDCPEHVLSKLTPTDNPSALEWRERCRKGRGMSKAFKSLPDGARATWVCPPRMSGLEEGRIYTIRKGKQNAWKKRSPWVWHIEGTRWCMKPSFVGENYELI